MAEQKIYTVVGLIGIFLVVSGMAYLTIGFMWDMVQGGREIVKLQTGVDTGIPAWAFAIVSVVFLAALVMWGHFWLGSLKELIHAVFGDARDLLDKDKPSNQNDDK